MMGITLMTSEIDIYRAANELIKHHGDDAAIYASMRADELLANGDLDGQRVWLKIIKVIDGLQSHEPPQGSLPH